MKGTVWFIAAVVAASTLVSGCGLFGGGGGPTEDIFIQMQKKATAIIEAGGLATVGIGSSQTINLALDKARTRGRTEIAAMLEARIQALKKDFTEEIGEGADSEYNSLFSTASKTVVSQVLRGTVTKDAKYKTAEGVTTACVLMVQDPKVIADALAAQESAQKSLYTRFQASKAFKELEAEVEKYDEFKKKEAAGVMGM